MVKRKSIWALVSLLMVSVVILASCQAAIDEEKEVEQVEKVAGDPTEEETKGVVEKEVVEEVGPEMVIDPSTGVMVEKPRYGGVINMAQKGDFGVADPWRTLDGGKAHALIYEVLRTGDWAAPRSECSFEMGYVPPQYVEDLLMEGYEVPDPLTYIIHLKKGVHFWDKPPVNGRELTADDIKWSIDRLLGLGEFEEAGQSPHVRYSRGWEALESIEVLDKYTCVLHMSEPRPMFPEAWGMERMPHIMPREVVDTYGDEFTWEETVGSGPWEIEDIVAGSIWRFKKFANYHGRDAKFPENQIPYADTLKCIVIPDWTTQLAALRAGKVDFLRVDVSDAPVLKESNPELEWNNRASVCYMAVVRNDLEPYSDIRVRKAMQMAINLEEINQEFYNGEGNPYPPIVNSAFTDLFTPLDELPAECQEAFRYNPEKAKELLAEAGYPDGFKQVVPRDAPWEFVDLFVSYWEAIGIETEIDMMETAVMQSFISSRQHELMFTYSCATWMPFVKLDSLWGGFDRISYNHGNVDDTVLKEKMLTIARETDPAERNRMLKEAIVYAQCQFYEIKGPEKISVDFWQPWIKGFQGEKSINAWEWYSVWSRVWVDEDLKMNSMGN